MLLTLTFNLLSFDIGNQERRDQILDDDLWLVALLFDLIEEVVDLGDLETSLLVSLKTRGVVDGLHDNRLQVGINRSLMHLHELTVEHVLSITKNLLSLTLTRLFSLALSSFVLSKLDHGVDSALLLQTHELFGEVVHGLGDNRSLDSLSDSVHDTLLIVVDKHVLLLSFRVLFPLFGGTELSNQIESLFLTLEHHVLVGTATKKSLEKNDGTTLLVSFFPLILVHLAVRSRHIPCFWGMSTKLNLFLFVALVSSLFSSLLIHSILNVTLGLVERSLVVTILSGKLLAELEADLIDANHGVEHLGLLDLENVVQLFQALVGGKSLWLDLVLVGFLVKRKTITSDWSVHS